MKRKRNKFRVGTQAEVAEFFGRTAGTVKVWQAAGMPGRSGSYDLRAIVAWLTTSGPWSKQAREDVDAALMSNGDSPALERFRAARADLAELEFKERARSVIPTSQSREWMGRLAGLLRNMGDKLGRRYGKEAQELLNSTLDEFDRQVRDALGGGT